MVHTRVVGELLLQQFKREKEKLLLLNLGLDEYISSIDCICEVAKQFVDEMEKGK